MRSTVLALALLLCCAASAHADDRLPVPDEAAQKQAAALVTEVFGKEIEDATTPDKQAALVKKLIEEAARPDTSSSGRYALLRIALQNVPDASVAVTVVDEMATHFQLDPLREKASTVWRLSKSARTALQHKSVAEAALQLVDDAVKRDAYDPALKLAAIALGAAQDAKDGSLVRIIKAKEYEVKKNKADFEKVQEAMMVLDKMPNDAEANLKVGTYKCLIQGEWEAGLPMLALGSDEILKDLATRELKMPTKSDEQVALADGWYDFAQKAGESNKERLLQRAGFWYQLSLKSDPALSRLVKVKVEKRLAKTTSDLSLGRNDSVAASQEVEKMPIKNEQSVGIPPGRYHLIYNNKFSRTVKISGDQYIVETQGWNGVETTSTKKGRILAIRPDGGYTIDIEGDQREVWYVGPESIRVDHWQRGSNKNGRRTQYGLGKRL